MSGSYEAALYFENGGSVTRAGFEDENDAVEACAALLHEFTADGSLYGEVFAAVTEDRTTGCITVHEGNALSRMERWESGMMIAEEETAFFRALVDSGIAWGLPAAYGLRAMELAESGRLGEAQQAMARRERAKYRVEYEGGGQG